MLSECPTFAHTSLEHETLSLESWSSIINTNSKEQYKVILLSVSVI